MVRLSIARKLPLAIAALALLVSAGVGIAGYAIASRTAEDLTFARLDGLAADRSDLLRSHLASLELSVQTAARSETVQNALRDLHFGWLKMADGARQQLFDAYVTKNPNPAGERSKLTDALTASNYDSAHSRVHPALQVLARSAGFEDIYLFDNDGNAVYTVEKGDDYAGAFAPGGAFAETGLGHLLAQLTDNQPGVSLSDIGRYAPSANEATAFMAAPVLDKRGVRAGSIAVRLPIAEFGTLINRRDGLGETGEVVIVGTDHLLRNDSAFSPKPDILETSFDNPLVDSALAGKAAKGAVAASYRSGSLLVDAVPLDDGNARWAVVTMVATGEAMGPVVAMGQTMLVSALVLMIVAGIAAWMVSHRITTPITRLTETMTMLTTGKLEVDVPYADGSDEIGDMARAVEVFRQNGVRVAELTEVEAGRAQREQAARDKMMLELQSAFGEVVAAAAEGDFSRKVETRFADTELNTLAIGINDIMEIVDRGLGEAGTVLGALAEADLTRRMDGNFKGAFATLSSDINKVSDRLSEIISQLRVASTTLSSATGAILAGSDDLAMRTLRQSATIEETSGTMVQLAETVSRNADRAKEASQLVARLTQTAEASGEVMNSATSSMERITASSNQISSIIGLIDDIAFQTNLLALNASVEAARAGDAGRGFAVVAVEVRRLAQSAANASSEVKTLVERSGDEVRSGTKQVTDAAAKIGEMLNSARTSNALVESIAVESRDQAGAIGNVSAAMRTLEEMTQHGSGLIEETNAAIAKADRQVAEMDGLVELFIVRPTEVIAANHAAPGAAGRPRPSVHRLRSAS
ncbi:MAG: methyl-accepting chemotaxis protein [Devosia sp.]